MKNSITHNLFSLSLLRLAPERARCLATGGQLEQPIGQAEHPFVCGLWLFLEAQLRLPLAGKPACGCMYRPMGKS